MSQQSIDSFGARGTLKVGDASYDVFRLSAVEGSAKLPFSLKVLLENLLRTEDGANITAGHIRALAGWDPSAEPDTGEVLHDHASRRELDLGVRLA